MESNQLGPAEKFDLANKNFKKVYRERGKKKYGIKYRYLHNWNLQKSRYLLNEDYCFNGNKKVYKRGAIVNVDFGVNIGTELSGNHFAIILNKKDTPKNDKLTVIPLTSHEHVSTVKLDETISGTSQEKLEKNIINSLVETYAAFFLTVTLSNELNETDKVPLDEWNRQINLSSEPQNKFLKSFIDIAGKNITTREVALLALKDSGFLKTDNINVSSISELLDVDEIKIKQQKLLDLSSKYSDYNKVTYAKINDITTISKSRLRKINEYDPIGDIKVSTEILNIIDSKIKEIFCY